jgi:hypothetical protein
LRPSMDVLTLFRRRVWTASFFTAAYHINFAVWDCSDFIWWFFSAFSSRLLNIYFKNGTSVIHIWIINFKNVVSYNLSFSSSSFLLIKRSSLLILFLIKPEIKELS